MASTGSNTAVAFAESRSLLDELVSPVAGASAKHRLKIIDRVTDLFAAGSRSYSDEQISLFDDVLRRLYRGQGARQASPPAVRH
jgi:hypothetical protein